MDKMSPEDKQKMMNSMMGEFLKGMSKGEKQLMMSNMMDTFMKEMFTGITDEERAVHGLNDAEDDATVLMKT